MQREIPGPQPQHLSATPALSSSTYWTINRLSYPQANLRGILHSAEFCYQPEPSSLSSKHSILPPYLKVPCRLSWPIPLFTILILKRLEQHGIVHSNSLVLSGPTPKGCAAHPSCQCKGNCVSEAVVWSGDCPGSAAPAAPLRTPNCCSHCCMST